MSEKLKRNQRCILKYYFRIREQKIIIPLFPSNKWICLLKKNRFLQADVITIRHNNIIERSQQIDNL